MVFSFLNSIEKPEAGNHPPSAGKALSPFHKADFRLRFARWSHCSEPWWDFSRLHPMELAFSQRADSNRDKPADAQDRFNESRMAADWNLVARQGNAPCSAD